MVNLGDALRRMDYELFKELDPDTLQRDFLNALLKIQNIQRELIRN